MIDKRIIVSLDKDDMLDNIRRLPEQLLIGWKTGFKKSLSFDINNMDSIVFNGMGGSAISGDLIGLLFREKLPIPLIVNRSYFPPGFINMKTLIIISSYSGNTEEALSSLNKAIENKCRMICITSGGKIESIAVSENYPLYTMDKGYPPRAALGISLGILLGIFNRLKINDISENDLIDTAHFLQELMKKWCNPQDSDNLPLTLAQRIKGKIPLIYGARESSSSIGVRWKTQLNENSKTHAFFQPFPEMNHNEIVGWELLPDTKKFFPNLCAVFLRSEDDHERNRYRMDITKSLIQDTKIDIIEVKAEGFSKFSRLMYLILMGDMVSYYLALIYGVDPTSIKKINRLKNKLK